MSTVDRLPATTPLVSLSPIVEGNDVIAISGEQFEDGRRRLVVGSHVAKDIVEQLRKALEQIEYEDGRIRWVSDLIAGVVGQEGESRADQS